MMFITDNTGRWDVFSNTTDSISASFNTEKELVQHLAQEYIYNGKLEAVETLMSFPHKRFVNGTLSRRNAKGRADYRKWYEDALWSSDTTNEFYGKIDNQLELLYSSL